MRRIEVIVKMQRKKSGRGSGRGVRVDVYEELKLFGKCKKKSRVSGGGLVGGGGGGWLVARLG